MVVLTISEFDPLKLHCFVGLNINLLIKYKYYSAFGQITTRGISNFELNFVGNNLPNILLKTIPNVHQSHAAPFQHFVNNKRFTTNTRTKNKRDVLIPLTRRS